jgi:hypothetical protein
VVVAYFNLISSYLPLSETKLRFFSHAALNLALYGLSYPIVTLQFILTVSVIHNKHDTFFTKRLYKPNM